MYKWSELDFTPGKEGGVIYDDDPEGKDSQVCRNYLEYTYSQSSDSTDSLELDGDGALIVPRFSPHQETTIPYPTPRN